MIHITMRIVGAVAFLVGAGATGYALRAAFERARGPAIAFGLLAAVTVLVSLTGLLLVFVPEFFSGSG
jgi:hypothetical protein